MQQTQATVKHIKDSRVPEPQGATWSNCLVVGNEIILSGLTAHPLGADNSSTEEQTARILEKADHLLQSAGTGRHAIYKLVIYITNMEDKGEVGKARAAFFGAGPYPCSTLLEVGGFAFPGLTVEIDVFARLDCDLRNAVTINANNA